MEQNDEKTEIENIFKKDKKPAGKNKRQKTVEKRSTEEIAKVENIDLVSGDIAFREKAKGKEIHLRSMPSIIA